MPVILRFMRTYKTPEHVRRTTKQRRDAIKAAGGQAYTDLLAKERQARKKYRAAHPDYWRSAARKDLPFKTALCAEARFRGRKRGIPATITPADIVWPSHCPVLGLALDYPERSGRRKDQCAKPNWPSLDRWDNTKGYVPGNVFVISFRANSLKNGLTRQEVLEIARYVMTKPVYRKETAGTLPGV